MKRIMILALAILFVLPVLPAFADGTAISLEEGASVDVSAPTSFTLSVAENFEKADIYADNTYVCTVEGDGSSEYTVEADFSKLHFLGETVISAKAYYKTYTETASKQIKLIKFNAEVEKYGEDFNAIKDGATGSITVNTQNKSLVETFVRSESDKAVSLVMSNKVMSSSPYFIRDNIGIQPGARVTLTFDAFVSENGRMALEMRDQNTENTRYPTNGGKNMASFLFMAGGKYCEGSNGYEGDTWNNIKIIINTASIGMEIYAKPDGTEEYSLVASYPNFKCIGFNQIRFTVGASTDDGAKVAIDNVSVKDLSLNGDWYAKESFENGELKLAFSKAMPQDKLYVTVLNAVDEKIPFTGNYDAETNVYTCTFDNKLNYGAQYKVKMEVVPTKNDKGEEIPSSEALLASDGSKRYFEGEITVENERYKTPVTFISDDGNNVTFNVDGGYTNGEMLMVCRYDGAKLVSANYVKGEMDMPEYSVALPGGEGESEIVIYILDSNLSVLDTFKK